MFAITFKRIIRTGFHSFWRNGFVSLAAVLIMVIALSVIGSTIFMNAGLNSVLSDIRSRVDVNVNFLPEATETDALELQDALEALPEVESVVYVSREEVLANFRERHKDDQVRLRALEELDDNPFGARLNIVAKDPTQYQGVADFLGDRNTSLSGEQVIDNVNFNENKDAIDRLAIIITSAERFGFFLGIILVVISIIITFNTIRLTIYVSREEISVMRLVGASVSYIRGPFMFTGVMYGLVSGLLTLIIFYLLTLWFGAESEALFGSTFNVFEYYTANFGQIFLVVVGSGIIIGATSSYLAVMRYLKS